MTKLAVFTEGQTEQIFLKRLIAEIGGHRNVHFELRSVPTSPTIKQLRSLELEDGKPLYSVLLYDCRSDERVKSEILDQLESLTRAGYDLILGLRDLYPTPVAEIQRVKLALKTRIPTAGVPIHILLAVAEIEAWFLQEDSHFPRLDDRLDLETFKAQFGFDPRIDSAEALPNPAALLHQIYSSVGKAYRKRRAHVERTVDVLDYESLYLTKEHQLPHLQEFLGYVNRFFDGAYSGQHVAG